MDKAGKNKCYNIFKTIIHKNLNNISKNSPILFSGHYSVSLFIKSLTIWRLKKYILSFGNNSTCIKTIKQQQYSTFKRLNLHISRMGPMIPISFECMEKEEKVKNLTKIR